MHRCVHEPPNVALLSEQNKVVDMRGGLLAEVVICEGRIQLFAIGLLPGSLHMGTKFGGTDHTTPVPSHYGMLITAVCPAEP